MSMDAVGKPVSNVLHHTGLRLCKGSFFPKWQDSIRDKIFIKRWGMKL